MMEMFFKACEQFPSGWTRGRNGGLYLSQCVLHTVIYIALNHVVPYLATKKLFAKKTVLMSLSLSERK